MTDKQTISRKQLETRLSTTLPDNEDAKSGYALVNVLGSDAFEQEHIPRSINIPLENLDAVGERFEKSKEIIVYCRSFDCDASPKAAKRLKEQGFENVLDYEGGMRDWKAAGNMIEASEVRG